MKILLQNLKNGAMQLAEVNEPAILPNQILVRTHFSAISSGTEGRTVKDARASYIGKAKSRPQEVKKVMQAMKKQGLLATYKLVMNKLQAPAPLGYSCAGEVIAVGQDIAEFKAGDLVACGGNSASHAEIVSIAKNLCTRVPQGVSLQHAAFTTLGAIAMQGVRQADLRISESAVVIGLGLLGQLTMQILQAAGVLPIGIDVVKQQVDLAEKWGGSAYLRSRPDLEQLVLQLTGGAGADAVIITAGTQSLDPIDLAGALCRKRGKVVVVGGVPTGFSRANYYRKELEVRMSCSYGPGRYDPQYEEMGIDYPIGYVRWTEQRNMASFLELIRSKKINLDPLVSHVFPFEQAADAYRLILQHSEAFCGVLLGYDVSRPLKAAPVLKLNSTVMGAAVKAGFIGAGSFALNFLLPEVAKNAGLIGIAALEPHGAKNVAEKYRFQYATTDASQIFKDPLVNTVFIATRHDSHAAFVLQALQAGKNAYVEKPLCMNLAQLEEIRQAYESSGKQLMVGFNRRFAPLIVELKNRLAQQLPKAILYRINAGILPPDHWAHDPKTGGGRIIGEACHFIDLVQFLAGAPISSVSAAGLQAAAAKQDTVSITIGFANGSTASICYFSNGNKELAKEYIEVFCGGQIGVIHDFQKLEFFSEKGRQKIKGNGDKGYADEIRTFCEALESGQPAAVPFAEIYRSMAATFAVLESLHNGSTVRFTRT